MILLKHFGLTLTLVKHCKTKFDRYFKPVRSIANLKKNKIKIPHTGGTDFIKKKYLPNLSPFPWHQSPVLCLCSPLYAALPAMNVPGGLLKGLKDVWW